MNLSQLTASDLLKLHAEIAEQLRARGISRTGNNPTGELAEYLFCKAFGWTLADNSKANIDAIGEDGCKYQIKDRRTTRYRAARQLSALRDLTGGHFGSDCAQRGGGPRTRYGAVGNPVVYQRGFPVVWRALIANCHLKTEIDAS